MGSDNKLNKFLERFMKNGQMNIAGNIGYLLVSLFFYTSVHAQTYNKISEVTYKWTEVQQNTKKQLYVRNSVPFFCGEAAPIKRIRKAELKAKLDLGENYLFGKNTFSSSINFTIKGYSSFSSNVTEHASYNQTISINQFAPEALLSFDFTTFHGVINRFEVSINSNSTSEIIKDSLRFKFFYTEDFATDVSNSSPLLKVVPFVGEVTSNPVIFKWDLKCDSVPAYEVQVLRLYNSNKWNVDEKTIHAKVDWNSATTIYTGNNKKSLALTLTEGTGYYIWRVRPIGDVYEGGYSDPRNWGAWTKTTGFGQGDVISMSENTPQDFSFFYRQFDEDKNWRFSRNFIEGNSNNAGLAIKEEISYANGLLQTKQFQAINKEANLVMANQTLYDYSGRPSISSLFAPINKQSLGYQEKLLTNASGNLYTPSDYDLDNNFLNPAPIGSASPVAQYYSDQNSDLAVPNAEGFPYKRNIYTNDGLEKIKESGEAGSKLKVGSGKTTRLISSSVSDEELIKIFGDEAPSAKSVYKEVVTDPNNTSVVTYYSYDGKKIAENLSYNENSNLVSLPGAATSVKPVNDKITSNIQISGNTISGSKEVLLTSPTTLTIKYEINQGQYSDDCAGLCQKCDYKLILIARNVDNPNDVHQKAIDLPTGVCTATTPFNTTASFNLNVGKYIIEKRLESFTNDATGKGGLDNNLKEVEAKLTNDINNSLAPVRTYLNNKDLDGLYNYLGASSIDTEKPFGIGFCESIRIPIERCKKFECNGNNPDFEKYFLDYWSGKDFAKINSSGFYVFLPKYKPGQFNSMIKNMLTDPTNPYTCEEVWTAWEKSVHGYTKNKDLLDPSRNTENVKYSFDFLEGFLENAGRKLRGFTSKPIGTGFDQASAGYLSHAYAYFEYTAGKSKDCEKMFLCNPSDASCNPAITSNVKVDWNNFYRCVLNNSQGSNVTNDAEKYAKEAVEKCNEVCDGRLGSFVTAIKDLYNENGVLVQGDQFYLEPDPNKSGSYRFSQNSLPEGYTGVYPETSVFCIATNLVNECKSSCTLTKAYFPNGKLKSVGTSAEIDAMRKAMTYNFELQIPVNGNSCSPFFKLIKGTSQYFFEEYFNYKVKEFKASIGSEGGCFDVEKIKKNYYKNKLSNCSWPTNLNNTSINATSSMPDCMKHAFSNGDGTTIYVIQSEVDQHGIPVYKESNVSTKVIFDPDGQAQLWIKTDYQKKVNSNQTDYLRQENFCNINGEGSIGCSNICFRWAAPVSSTTTIHIEPNNCEDEAVKKVMAAINGQVEQILEKKLSNIKSLYTKNCTNALSINDKTEFTYNIGNYHYTLYYYDRSGNLIKTVAPKGIVSNISNRLTHPSHKYVTNYRYNSLGQLVSKKTPDAGEILFWYNNKGQLRFSQDAQQALSGKYNYWKYDLLGRSIETGEIKGLSTDKVEDSSYPNFYQFTEIGYIDLTEYSNNKMISGNPVTFWDGREQRFLNNRVSAVSRYRNAKLVNNDPARTSIYYSYDPHGNLEWMIQDQGLLGRNYIEYDYDPITGLLLSIKYNEGFPDKFFQRYTYNSDKFLSLVETSKDGVIWDKDADYKYYLHGPLKRMELGEDKLQGVDYVYTLQGWLKGINHSSLDKNDDPGKDGSSPGAKPLNDIFGLTLNFFKGDFNRSYQGNASPYNSSNAYYLAGKDLFNGNISGNTSKLNHTVNGLVYQGMTGNSYTYDELNRLMKSELSTFASNTKQWQGTSDFREEFSYDENGNILTLNRNGYSLNGNPQAMDALKYNYQSSTNKLSHVDDAIGTSNYATDIDDQSELNFGYDLNGNITKDLKEGVTKITWTPEGKVDTIYKSNGEKICYFYNAIGNRVRKDIIRSNNDPTQNKSVFYIVDSRGQVLATYERNNRFVSGSNYTASIKLMDQGIYAMKRLGLRSGPLTEIKSGSFSGNNDPAKLEWTAKYKLGAASKILIPSYEFRNGVIFSTSRLLTYNGGNANLGNGFEYGKGIPGRNCNTYLDESGNVVLYVVSNNSSNQQALLFTGNNSAISGSFNINADVETQAFITKVPSSNSLYYLFTIGKDKKAYYHIIDLITKTVKSKNNLIGNGGRNMALFEDFTGGGKSVLYIRDYVGNVGSGSLNRERISSYYITNNGLQFFSERHFISDDDQSKGQMAISPDGTFMAFVANTGKVGDGSFTKSNLYIDKINSNKSLLGSSAILVAQNTSVNTVEWSEKGGYVFFGTSSALGSQIFRYFADGSKVSQVPSSKINHVMDGYGDIRRGSNGKIYIPGGTTLYELDNTDAFTVKKQNIQLPSGGFIGYLPPNTFKSKFEESNNYKREVDSKVYELADHLGNVRATIGDVKLSSISGKTPVNFTPDVKSYNNYYAFGMQMPGRNYQGVGYRYGFNGMEKADEVKGDGNSYTSLYREYDPRLGRWLSIDPKEEAFPSLTPYNNNENNPIINTDPNGDCPWCFGALIGAAVDIGLQIAEISLDKNKSMNDFSLTSVAVSAASGAVGVGIATKIDKALKVANLASKATPMVVKVATGATTDAGTSAVGQFVKDGKIDGVEVLIDAAGGQIVGGLAGSFAEKIAKKSPVLKVLDNEADRAERLAKRPNPRRSRVEAAQQAAKKAENFAPNRGAAAGTAASGVTSDLVKKGVKDDEKK